MECRFMGLFNKILGKNQKKNNKPKISQNNNLDSIKKVEEEHNSKLLRQGEKYYFSDEAKTTGKQLYHDQKEYVKNNPQDYEMVAAQMFQTLWNYVEELPSEERKIFTLTGKGKYYEDQEEYEKAIEYYQQADDLTMRVCRNDIQQLINENGPGDYLYCAKIRQRIRVCQKPLIKEMETEAKGLEKTNPREAIEIYEELNRLKPGLKKYNKRIEICKKRL